MKDFGGLKRARRRNKYSSYIYLGALLKFRLPEGPQGAMNEVFLERYRVGNSQMIA